MTRHLSFPLAVWFFVLLFCHAAYALGTPPAFESLAAMSSYPFVADMLPDGRFILVDSAGTVWLQTGLYNDAYEELATGYAGDPGFIAASPDAHTVVICSGFGGHYWFLDIKHPVDAGTPLSCVDGSGTPISLTSSYWGEWISADRLLVDRAPVFLESELGIIDFSGSVPVYKVVVNGKDGASAAFTLDASGRNVYACLGTGDTGLTRRFAVADLSQAFDEGGPLAWSSGVAVGAFEGAGPFACTDKGTLIYGAFGYLLFADPVTGETATATPPGGDFIYMGSGAYSSVTGRLLISGTDYSDWPNVTAMAWSSHQGYENLPVGGLFPAAVLAILLILVGTPRLKRAKVWQAPCLER